MVGLPFDYAHFGVNNSRVWFHQVPLSDTEAIFERSMQLLEGANIHWDRVHLPGVFSWNIIEPERGRFDWTIPDALVKAAQRHNVHLSPNIWVFAAWDQKGWEGTGRPLNTWQHAGGRGYEADDTYPVPPKYDIPHDMEAYERFIEALVGRYSGVGPNTMPGLEQPIKYWEPGNEVGAHQFWPQYSGAPGYTKVLKTTYLATKRVDPDTKILIEGWNFTSNEPYFRHAIETGLKEGQQYFDIINVHNNRAPIQESIDDIYKTKALMAEYGVSFPIWNTEWSTYAEAPPPQLGNRPPFYLAREFAPHTEQDQARYVPKGLSICYYLGVEKIFWGSHGDIKPEGVVLSEPVLRTNPDASRTYSMLFDEYNRQHRMVYHTLKLFLEKLDAFKAIERLDLGPGINAFRYDVGPEWDPALHSRYVLWSDAGNAVTLSGLRGENIITVNTIPETAADGTTALDASGNARHETKTHPVVDGAVTLQLGEDPLIVEF